MASSSHDTPHTPKQNRTASNAPPKETPISNKHNSQLKISINTDGTEAPANFKKKGEVEERIRGDIAKTMMKGFIGLVDGVFPDAIIKVNAGGIDNTLEIDTLRNGDGWILWPSANESISEEDMAKFILQIRDTVKASLLPDSDPRHCTAMFKDHGVLDLEWKTSYQPDNIIIEAIVKDANRRDVMWANIVVALEVKSNEKQLAEAISQCSRYSQSIFDAQPGRRFVPGVVVCGTKVTFLIFDRSGLIASEAISVHDNPQKFLRLIIGLLFADEEYLGFEPTLRKGEGGSLFIETGGVDYMVDCIYNEFGIKGRGTVCYHGVSQVDKSEVVIKDSWVDVGRQETEVGILMKLNERKPEELSTPDGVRVIPEIVHHEVLKTKRPDHATGGWKFVDATTAIFRDELVVRDGNDEPKWAWSSKDEKTRNKVEIRRLCRIVMKPFGQKLDSFTSKKVLVRAFADVVHGTFSYKDGLLLMIEKHRLFSHQDSR